MLKQIWTALVDRPPLTEGWHLVVLLAVGVIVVAAVHRVVRRRVAQLARTRPTAERR